ncbi:glyoxalase [Bordetella avium]|nr:glyoxalase [Bordetella avium]
MLSPTLRRRAAPPVRAAMLTRGDAAVLRRQTESAQALSALKPRVTAAKLATNDPGQASCCDCRREGGRSPGPGSRRLMTARALVY